jgi:cytochrome c biogenesis protein CcmG, thiol:disulfide interchange protein DsbE
VIAIAAEEHSELVTSFMAATRAEFPVCADPEGKVQGPWSVNQLPTEVLIDKKGVVRFRHEGGDAELLEKLGHEVEQLLREP